MVENSGNKYKSWVFTIQATKGTTLPGEQTMLKAIKTLADKYVYQLEKATSLHYQGCMTTRIRKRHRTVLNEIVAELDVAREQVTLSPMQGSWEQAKAYCAKTETSLGPVFTNEVLYTGKDVELLDDPARRYPWQNKIIDLLFDDLTDCLKDADDRTIIWLTDTEGNNGKSKFVKWCCFNNDNIIKISFGSSSQLRSAIIAAGPRKLYFVDIPRTLGSDDSIHSLMSALEDLKNGYLVSSMYGKNETLLLDPPHIVVFSNKDCPVSMLTNDRWKQYAIIPPKKQLALKNEDGLWKLL